MEYINPAVVFDLGALGLFVLGAFLFMNPSIGMSVGPDEYERRRRRRRVAAILMKSALPCAGIALVFQIFSRNSPAVNSPRISSGTLLMTQNVPKYKPAANSPPISSSAGQPKIAPVTPSSHPPALLSSNEPVPVLLHQAFQLLEQKQLDAALGKVNAALQAAPLSSAAFGLRGAIYAEKKLWDQAEKDYQTALQLDGKNVQIKFNLAEIEFMQKKYDDARPGFIALKQDPHMGDLAAYKVFLCDLFGAHDEAAAKELDAFNQVGSNASYYFANAAWSLYHHKTEDARAWLMSAAKIYEPPKFRLYAASLIALGYMPLPPPPQQ
jgi:Tfp pilus assembly protein PilF